MDRLELHEAEQTIGANFTNINSQEVVVDYGELLAEHQALIRSAGVLDLSFRGRLCLVGSDRVRFLHGQVTNDIKGLAVGQGCYAALVTAKGRMQSDLNVYNLADELLLDFEPGLTELVAQRLEKYIVADDVQIVNVAPLYGLLSVQGPQAEAVTRNVLGATELPSEPFRFTRVTDPTLGELYVMNRSRLQRRFPSTATFASDNAPGQSKPTQARVGPGDARHSANQCTSGFDLFVPVASLKTLFDRLFTSAKSAGGRACGWNAFEIARVEAGIPRFGIDIDETNFPQECGIEDKAVSYTKGCYIGQEILNRIHTLGHVNKQLRRFKLAGDFKSLPKKRDKLLLAGSEVGYITTAVYSPAQKCNIALGYLRKEVGGAATDLLIQTAECKLPSQLVESVSGA
jgi:folate-binding protein YgfZ